MTRLLTDDDRDEMKEYIYLDSDGDIVYQSVYKKKFNTFGDFDLLLRCIENHPEASGFDCPIDYNAAMKEYNKIMQSRPEASGSRLEVNR